MQPPSIFLVLSGGILGCSAEIGLIFQLHNSIIEISLSIKQPQAIFENEFYGLIFPTSGLLRRHLNNDFQIHVLEGRNVTEAAVDDLSAIYGPLPRDVVGRQAGNKCPFVGVSRSITVPASATTPPSLSSSQISQTTLAEATSASNAIPTEGEATQTEEEIEATLSQEQTASTEIGASSEASPRISRPPMLLRWILWPIMIAVVLFGLAWHIFLVVVYEIFGF